MNDTPFPVPSILGNYRDLSFTGQGAVGAVFRAKDVSRGRTVALKILHPQWSAHAEVKSRFLQEARILARLDHPGVVRIYEMGEQEGFFFIAMEWLEGEDLRAFLKRENKMSWAQAARWIREAALGLAAAHDVKVLHRDLKPENLFLVSPGNGVKLLDFGLAKVLEEATTLSLQGNFVGTPRYLSPEQIKGLPVDERSDLYSLGIVFFELLAGRPPFQAESVSAVVYQQLHESPSAVLEQIPDLPGSVRSLIESLLSKNPEHRPRSAASLVDALDAILKNPSAGDFSRDKKNGNRVGWFFGWGIFILFLVLAFHALNVRFRISAPGDVSFRKTGKGWVLEKDGAPFEVRGVRYQPWDSRPELSTERWDQNRNQIPDVLESFLDLNQNGTQDADEPAEGDFRLMRKMGFNTILLQLPLYDPQHAREFSEFHSRLREILKKGFEECGMEVMLAHPCPSAWLSPEALSAWADSLKRSVSLHAKEPYLLGWMLDAGQTLPLGASSLSQPFEDFLRQVFSLAAALKEADPRHPVVLGDLMLEDAPALKNALKDRPSVDALGFSAFLSAKQFSKGNLAGDWFPEKPVCLTAFGCPAFNGVPGREDGDAQARFLEECLAGSGQKFQGTFLWEWMDCWDRDGHPETQDVSGKTWLVFPDGESHAEWMGIVARDPRNPLARRPRTFALKRIQENS